MPFAIVIDSSKVQRVVDQLAHINTMNLRKATLTAVNGVAQRAYDESISTMLSRVNLAPAYVSDRMVLEPANDKNADATTAKVVALRPGGRRKAMRNTTLRQFTPIYAVVPVKYPHAPDGKPFTMRDGRAAVEPWGKNPRAPGRRLPYIMRVGNPMISIPAGQKLGDISVEVKRGARKVIGPAKGTGFKPFMMELNSGLQVVRRINRTGAVKGKRKGQIEVLYSLSVWQMFNGIAAEIVPLVTKDLTETLAGEVEREVNRAFQ